jgi:hypothetical protein
VLDAHEWRLIAEAHARKDRDVVVALAPGTYHVKRVMADHLDVGVLALGADDRANVDRIHFDSQPLSVGVLKGDPSTLSPAERIEWWRQEGFRLLAEGQAAAALGMFDRLLRQSHADAEAWRGRARALVRLAEGYERVGDMANERKMLMNAMRADPSLGSDETFQILYKQITELDTRAQTDANDRAELDYRRRVNPRMYKRFGVGFDLFSASGMFTINATMVVKRIIMPRLSIDIAGPGIDASVIIAPLPHKWSPYLGLGGHVSAKNLGIDFGNSSTMMTGTPAMPGSINSDDVWGTTARIEAGAQFVSNAGFTTELGLAMIVYRDSMTLEVKESLGPMLHFGWLW